MFGSATLLDPLEARLSPPARDEFRLGLLVPRSGPLGLTSPAALASAALAAEEVNASGGVQGRRMSLAVIDAGRAPADVATEVRDLVEAESLVALVGFHTSDVHRAIERVTADRIPYLFTPPHEGGDRMAGVALSGPGPLEQLGIALGSLVRRSTRRWALVGNDYIWPRAVHAAAATLIRDAGGDVVASVFVPLGRVEAERVLATIEASGADAILLSLVGRDLVTFNRAFAASRMRGRVLRVSGALDETGLLEIGGDESGDLFAAMDWFASDSDEDGFVARYAARWGESAPQLGVYARGCYDGLHLVADIGRHGAIDVPGFAASVRRRVGRWSRLACADGTRLVAMP